MLDSQRCPQCNSLCPPGVPSCSTCGLAFSSPTPGQGATRATRGLILNVTAELPPQRFEIAPGSIEIGRLDASDVTLPHQSVSRRHARISGSSSGFTVEDLGSKNGTCLNDRPISGESPLADGDTLLIGDVPLKVELVFAAEPPPPPPPTPPPPTPVPPTPAPQPNVSAATELPPRPPVGGASTVMIGLHDALPGLDPPAVATPSDSVPSAVSRPDTAPNTGPPSVAAPPGGSEDDTPASLMPWQVQEVQEARRAATHEDPPTLLEPLPLVVDTNDFEPVRLEGAPLEPAALSFARMAGSAEQLAAELRAFGADLSMAVWLFEHAGGGAAVQAFVEQVNAAHENPQDQAALERLMAQTPTAARLLQAALMLFNALLPLDAEAVGDEQAQANTSELEPIAGP